MSNTKTLTPMPEPLTPQAFLEAFIMAFTKEYCVRDAAGNSPEPAFVALGDIARDNAYTRGFNDGREQGYQLGLCQVAQAKALTLQAIDKAKRTT